MNSLDRHRRSGELRSSLAQRKLGTILAFFSALLGISVGAVAIAQTTPLAEQPVSLTVETTDNVLDRGDTVEYSKLAKNPNPTTSVSSAFVTSVNLGDVRMVNGQPAKGISLHQAYALPMRANPQPGQAIADATSTGIVQCIWQILSPDGKYIGTLIDSGAAPSPDHIITGGSGAFQGMSGVHGGMQTVAGVQRGASTSEDLAVRRILSGGGIRTFFTLYPKSRRTVITTPNGPAVVHSDGKVVSSSNPAQAGETLTLYATGLSPTTPSVTFGQPFPQGAASVANAPIEVLVNGKSSSVLYAGGYSGAIDRFQVNFRLPAPLSPGNATLRLTAASIPGPEITIATK